MTFVHPLLLGGLLLVGIPVLIHLIMQQKPKRLPFPAFRFLLQKQRTNQRRLRLRHLLLLALRVLLIAAICLALARPKLFSNRLGIGSDRPVAAVLLFDTSQSMEYKVSKQTRLDEAKRRALELLEVLPAESRIAVLDSAEPGGEWLLNRAQAEDRITGLKLRPVNAPVTRQIGQAYRLFNDLDREQGDQTDELPRFLYVFSDRTLGCWDASEAKVLHPPDGLNTVFVDVGVDNPVDLALVGVEIPRQIVHPGDRAEIGIRVQATGEAGENDLGCLRVGEGAEKQPVRLPAGASEVKLFYREAVPAGDAQITAGALPPGFQQFEMKLFGGDALPFNNIVFATVKVQEGRQILIVTDNPGKPTEKGDAGLWLKALNASHQFPCEVVSPKAAEAMGIIDLNKYETVCLLDLAKPSDDLWKKLETYVQGGKGLAVILGGKDWQPSRDLYNSGLGRKIIGAKLDKLEISDGQEVFFWKELGADVPKAGLNPLIRYFRDQSELGELRFTEETRPHVRWYWKLLPDAGQARPIATYTDKENTPAVLEQRLGKGRVLLVTTAFDGHKVQNYEANNYFVPGAWFGPVFIIKATGYLAGDAEAPNFNFTCGQTVTLPLPSSPSSFFRLFGPGVGGVDVQRAKGENALRITQAVEPGNYSLFDPSIDPDNHRVAKVAAFSLNPPAEESQLDRVPVEQIETLLGPGSVLTVERGSTLADAIRGHWLQPLELFPWLMILVLLVLAVENLLANKFYRRGKQEEAAVESRVNVSAKPQAAEARGLAPASNLAMKD